MILSLMNDEQSYGKFKFAAGGVLLLAALFITACGATSTPVAERDAETATPADVTPIPTITATSTTVVQGESSLTPSVTATATATRRLTSTPRPTRTPTATPLARSALAATLPTGEIRVSETTIALPTYPIWDYLVEEIDPVYNMPVLYFNRPAFEAASPTPAPVDYTGVILENDYVRLTFLPELGGRLYSAVIKATGQEIFYHNPVVKPSRYGILEPVEANWWLATGGMEWAYPTQEHGYRWGVPWTYTIQQHPDRVTITLSDTGLERVGVEVAVTLPADSPVFTVAPKLMNNTAQEVPVQFWLNAALTLEEASMSPNTQFIVPAEEMVVHSRGGAGWELPEAREATAWPVIDGKNLRDYEQWADYLGFFIPYMNAPFMGAYNPDADLGVIRLIEPGQIPGSKVFAFGREFAYRDYTDDDSQYFELWGGVNTGFWPEDDLPVAAGASLQWQEQWWPVAGLGGLTGANDNVAFNLTEADGRRNLTLLLATPTQGELTILSDDTVLLTETISANPGEPLAWPVTTEESLHIQLIDQRGALLLDYTAP